MCIDLTVRMETSVCVADAANWGNIELAGTNPTYRPLPVPHRCEECQTFRTIDVSYHGRFVPWTFRTFLGLFVPFVPRTFRTILGLFVPL